VIEKKNENSSSSTTTTAPTTATATTATATTATATATASSPSTSRSVINEEEREVRSGLGEQIENIILKYLERIWPTLHFQGESERPEYKLRELIKKEGKNITLIDSLKALEQCNYDIEAAEALVRDQVKDSKNEVVVVDKQKPISSPITPTIVPPLKTTPSSSPSTTSKN